MLSNKQKEQLSSYGLSLVTYGLAATIGLVYFTDWKAVAMYIPYYNKKFPVPKVDAAAPAPEESAEE